MLRFIDGFDHYAIGDLLGKWTGAFTAAGATGIGTSVPARTGAACLYLGDSNWVHLANPGGSQATLVIGFGFRYTVADNNVFCLVFGEQGTDAAHSQCGVRLNTGGTLSACRSTSTAADGMRPGYGASGIAVLGTTAVTLAIDEWNYLEVKVTISNSAGVFVIKVNGALALNLSSIDTQFQTDATASHVALGGPYIGGSGRHAFDDVYLADGVAGDVTDVLGPQRVATVLPSTGNGTHVDWTPSTGTDHGALVDDATPNGDTDYVESTTVGHRDTYHFPALGITGTVNGVQATQWAKITTAGARGLGSSTRISSTTYDGASSTALDTTYRAARQLWATSPASSAAWTIAEIDGAQYGPLITS